MQTQFNQTSFSYLRVYAWKEELGRLAGRLWSICSYPLKELIERITSAVQYFFNSNSSLENNSPENDPSLHFEEPVESPTEQADIEQIGEIEQTFEEQQLKDPVKSPKENLKKPTYEETEWDLSNCGLFSEEEAFSTSNKKDDCPSPLLPSSQEDIHPTNPSPSTAPIPIQSEPAIQSQEHILLNKFKRKAKKHPSPKTPTQTSSLEYLPPKKLKRKAKIPASNPSTQFFYPPMPKVKTSSNSIQTKNPEVSSKHTSRTFMIIDAGAKGNCQILSFLKGLEMQYPELASYEKGSQKLTYTAQDLREAGVAFARTQIDKCGKYAAMVLGYLDSDRKEYNESITNKIERSFQQACQKLDKRLQDKIIQQPAYEKQLEKLKEKRQDLTDRLDKYIIKTDADFLNRLEKSGFYCSSLHLFALNILFNLPIYVEDSEAAKGHEVQMFNSTRSDQSPIYLYRTNNIHYQLKLFKKQINKV